MTLKEMLDWIWNSPGVCHPIHKAKWKILGNWVWPNTKYMRYKRSARKGIVLR